MPLRSNCLACNSKLLDKIIDLGSHCFADRFIDQKIFDISDPTYTLSCSICNNCGFIQNDLITNPEDRYIQVDYSYTAANSSYSVNHWREYSSKCISYHGGSVSSVLEIGSNDGTLLEAFKEIDSTLQLTGVDASPKMVEICKEKNLDAHLDIFGSNDGEYLKEKKYDLVVANNVLNHSDSPVSFLSLAKRKLKNKQSLIIFELPYWKSLVDDKRFDQIYHEHVSYFTIFNSRNLLALIGLEINHVEINNYHGGSLRVFCSIKNNRTINSSVLNYLNQESYSELRSLSTYEELNYVMKINKIKVVKKILDANLSNRKVICIGAAAKANTLLTYYGLDKTIVNFITDSSPYKIGKYTPLTRIPILPDSAIKDIHNPLCLITSWNIGEILKEKIFKINPSAEIILPH